VTAATFKPPKEFKEPGVEIYPGVHAIGPSRRGQNQGGYSRAYLFENDGGLTLVDTLWDHDAHMLLHYLWDIRRTPKDITDIAMTHAHRSHLGGLKILKELSGATVHSHAWEAPIIEGERRAQKIPLRPLRPVELIGFRVASQLGIQPHIPCRVDNPTLGAGTKTIGALNVIPLPGHTPGNVVFSYDDDAVLAVADTIMTWPHFSAGWPGFNYDEREFRAGVEDVVEMEPKVVCTGHGDPIWVNAAERIRTLVDPFPA
jgi:glyoxylase-like metal-dependent hydrolase (beta-lactamase superfamily II)